MMSKTEWHEPPFWLRIYVEALFWLRELRATNETRDWQWIRLNRAVEAEEPIITGRSAWDLDWRPTKLCAPKLIRHEFLQSPTACRLQGGEGHPYMVIDLAFISKCMSEGTEDYTNFPAFYISEPVSYDPYTPHFKRIYWAPASGEARRVDRFGDNTGLKLSAGVTRVQQGHNWAELCLSRLVVYEEQKRIASVKLDLPLPGVVFDDDGAVYYRTEPVPRVTGEFEMEGAIDE